VWICLKHIRDPRVNLNVNNPRCNNPRWLSHKYVTVVIDKILTREFVRSMAPTLSYAATFSLRKHIHDGFSSVLLSMKFDLRTLGSLQSSAIMSRLLQNVCLFILVNCSVGRSINVYYQRQDCGNLIPWTSCRDQMLYGDASDAYIVRTQCINKLPF
jgi:hypothetical protein